MRVLVFHGYLLRGTGSNVYNSSLAQALARLGHEVHLLCQDRSAGGLDWVDSVGGEGRPGAVTVHIPDIGGLLPVYVADSYAGFDVKTFRDLSEAELDRYVEANVEGVGAVLARAGPPDAALANHLVMGPLILARAGLEFAAKVHGSALEYTVKPEPERFLPYAREGMEAAAAVLTGSRHTAESLWQAMRMPGLPAKTRLGPPGVDTDVFSPVLNEEEGRAKLRDLALSLKREHAHALKDRRPGAWGRDPGTAAEALEWFAEGGGPRVVFVGKLIVSKGVDLLLAAWPLVLAAHPQARLLVIGFGEYREALQRLWMGLAVGNMATAREIARRGRGLEGGEEAPLEMLGSFLDDPERASPEYRRTAVAGVGSVRFAGRLEHGEVARVIPAADALVFPSTFPEAFGMVAAEAAAAGVLPVGAAHSGIAEVSSALAAELPEGVGELVSFPLGERAIEGIAERLGGWLALPAGERDAAREALRATVSRLWSWEGVARGVLDASAGELDALARIPDGG